MNITILAFICISLVLGGLAFFITNSLYLLVGVTLVFLLYFLLYAKKKLITKNKKINRFKSCFHFINSFIVALNIKGSLIGAFETTNVNMDEEYLSIYNGIKNYTEIEKLDYLASFYPFHTYSLFLKIIKLWVEQGGDILSMSNELISQSRNDEEYIVAVERMGKNKIIEFSILWFFSLLILVVLRFALNNFFDKLSNQIFYIASIGVYFLFLLGAIHYLIIKITSIDINGWNEYE